MSIDVLIYKLNECRMMLNDGEHPDEQRIIFEAILALSNPDSNLAENCRSAYERGFKDGKRAAIDEFKNFVRIITKEEGEDNV